ncbi:MAG TPA: trimeric intracellular cation channel family protein [Nocardioidaceae bacterium]|nr:trimeric intracellular cation channel family protein [Nocardioidaceae bacterium]
MDVSNPGVGGFVVALDLVGVFAFAISGGLVAVRKALDIFGVLVLAAITGLGGGTLRDVLIGALPPAALQQWPYIAVSVAAGLLAFRFHPALSRMERVVGVFDAAGLGVFCVTGALKALEYGMSPFAAALMGLLTSIGGGIARDVLAGRVPIVLRAELYATPALAGAAAAVALDAVGAPLLLVTVPPAVLCVGWRLLAMRRGWQAPYPPSATLG